MEPADHQITINDGFAEAMIHADMEVFFSAASPISDLDQTGDPKRTD